MFLLRLGIGGTMLFGMTAWALFLAILMVGEPLWLVVASLSLNGLWICCYLVAGQVFANGRARADVRVSVQALLNITSGIGLLAGNLLVGWVRRETQEQFEPTYRVGNVDCRGLADRLFPRSSRMTSRLTRLCRRNR